MVLSAAAYKPGSLFKIFRFFNDRVNVERLTLLVLLTGSTFRRFENLQQHPQE
jgi:hypothetical protein